MNPACYPSGVRPTGETNTYRVVSGSVTGLEYQVVIGLGCDCPHFRMGDPARIRRAAGGELVWAGVCKHYRRAAAMHGLLAAEALLRIEGRKYLGP